MLKTRIKTGAILTVVVLLFLHFSYLPYVLNIFAALLSTIGAYELFRAANCMDKRFPMWSALLLAAVFPFVVPLIPGNRLIISALLVTALILFFIFASRVENLSFARTWKPFAVSLTISVLYSSIPILREERKGFYYVCLVILTSVITEVAAYFIGKAIGKHKVAPKVSPGKTIEGCLGGSAVTCILVLILGIAVSRWKGFEIQYAPFTCYIILASLIGQIGDLSMSLIKRSAGIKDFGNLMPGHGGVLDRFDSQLFIAPFTLLYSFLFPFFGGR